MAEQPENEKEYIRLHRFLKIVSFITKEWCEKQKDDEQFFEVIDFEKLITFIARFWNFIYSASSQVVPQSVTSFHFLRERQAKHGRRFPKVDTNTPSPRNLIFINVMLESLQKENTFRYLKIVTPPKKETDYSKLQFDDAYSLEAEDPQTKIFAGELVKQLEPYIKSPYNFENRLVSEMSKATNNLNSDEIRALGTHENAQKTQDDVIKEYKDLVRSRVRDQNGKISFINVIKGLTTELSMDYFDIEKIKKILSFVREAKSKSLDNRKPYSTAYQKLFQALQADSKGYFLKLQRSPEEIWNDGTIKSLAKETVGNFDLINFIKDLSKLQSVTVKNIPHKLNEAISVYLVSHGLQVTPDKCFANGILNAVVKKHLQTKLTELELWINELKTSDGEREINI